MKIQPLFDRVVLLPIDSGQLSKAGLLIPDVAARSSPWAYGDVVAIGSGRIGTDGRDIPMRIAIGDVVMYARRSGQPLPIPDDSGDEIEHVLIREVEILATVSGLARSTGLLASDGRLLAMMPASSAIADSSLRNAEELEEARRGGWDVGDIDDHVDEVVP